MKYIATVKNNGIDFWLRGTVWSYDKGRATRHDTAEAAQKALDKAKQFMTTAIYRRAVIVPEQEGF